MTHDELLDEINANLCGYDDCDSEHYRKEGLYGEWFALRAIVELHKPNYGLCKACTTSTVHVAYPCPTIQAIERELNE